MFQLSIFFGLSTVGRRFWRRRARARWSMADSDRDETIKTLQQMNLRLSHLDNQLDQNFKSQHEVLQEHVGRLHMSIEAIAQSLEQLNYTVCKMKDPHDEMGEQRSTRSIGPVMKLRTGTVQSLVQMQSAVLQELVSGNKVTSRRSDADSGLQAKCVCFPWVFLKMLLCFSRLFSKGLGSKIVIQISILEKPVHVESNHELWSFKIIKCCDSTYIVGTCW